jgi:hypothetical protein
LAPKPTVLQPMPKRLDDLLAAIKEGTLEMGPGGLLGPISDFDPAELAEDGRVLVHLQEVYYTRETSGPHARAAGRLIFLLGEAAEAIGGMPTFAC